MKGENKWPYWFDLVTFIIYEPEVSPEVHDISLFCFTWGISSLSFNVIPYKKRKNGIHSHLQFIFSNETCSVNSKWS